MKITKIAKVDLIANEWDGGKTYEYFIYPPEAKYIERNFLFRISSATIEKAPSHFTRFENYQRYLVMLDNSLEIIRNGKQERYDKHELFTFDSNDAIVSYSLGNDFNLMVADGSCKFEVVLNQKELEIFSENIFLFAKQTSKVFLNDAVYFLNENDLLFINNKEQNFIKIVVKGSVIACFLDDNSK